MDCSPPGSSVHGILQGRILEWVAIPSPPTFNLSQHQSLFLTNLPKPHYLGVVLIILYAEYIMRNAKLDEAQAGIKIAGRNINHLRLQITPP